MRILIIDGNTHANNKLAKENGTTPYYIAYGDVLKALRLDVEIDYAHPVEDGLKFFSKDDLSGYDGFAWTGSPLNLYAGGVQIDNQRRFGEAVFAHSKPVFGSCWGLQINAELLGGEVILNPKGREVGIARTILVNETGQAHKLYHHKQAGFDAFGVHSDIVNRPPEGAEILAYNEMSAIQALVYERNGVDFWGVQYHPEFDFTIMARILRRIAGELVDENLFQSVKDVEAMANDYDKMAHVNADDLSKMRPIIMRLGLTNAVMDMTIHRQELKNWLNHVANFTHKASSSQKALS